MILHLDWFLPVTSMFWEEIGLEMKDSYGTV